eukprot:511001-Pyramimonas_sp.AAC.1
MSSRSAATSAPKERHADSKGKDGEEENGGGGRCGRIAGRKRHAGHRLFKTMTQHRRTFGNTFQRGTRQAPFW